jgi:large subunit ribosomal protein L30
MKVKVTQIKSTIDRPERQKRIIQSLGLKKINHSVIHEDSPEIMGMINKVLHLITIQEA